MTRSSVTLPVSAGCQTRWPQSTLGEGSGRALYGKISAEHRRRFDADRPTFPGPGASRRRGSPSLEGSCNWRVGQSARPSRPKSAAPTSHVRAVSGTLARVRMAKPVTCRKKLTSFGGGCYTTGTSSTTWCSKPTLPCQWLVRWPSLSTRWNSSSRRFSCSGETLSPSTR